MSQRRITKDVHFPFNFITAIHSLENLAVQVVSKLRLSMSSTNTRHLPIQMWISVLVLNLKTDIGIANQKYHIIGIGIGSEIISVEL